MRGAGGGSEQKSAGVAGAARQRRHRCGNTYTCQAKAREAPAPVHCERVLEPPWQVSKDSWTASSRRFSPSERREEARRRGSRGRYKGVTDGLLVLPEILPCRPCGAHRDDGPGESPPRFAKSCKFSQREKRPVDLKGSRGGGRGRYITWKIHCYHHRASDAYAERFL